MQFTCSNSIGIDYNSVSSEFITKYNELEQLCILKDPATDFAHYGSNASNLLPAAAGTPSIIKWAWWKIYNAMTPDQRSISGYHTSGLTFNGENLRSSYSRNDLAYTLGIDMGDAAVINPNMFKLRIIRITRGINNAFTVLDAKEAELNRLKDLELPFVQNIHHKLRLYQDKRGVILMVTNQFNESKTLWQFFGMLPVFYPTIKRLIQQPENATLVNIFKAFYECNGDALVPYLEEDFKTINEIRLTKDLEKFKTVLEKIGSTQIESIKAEVASLQRNVDSLYANLRGYERDLHNKQRILTGLEILGTSVDLSALEMLKHSSKIRLMESNTDYLKFKVTTALANYMKSDMQSYYRGTNFVTNTAWLASLLKETFIEEKYQLVMTTFITVPLNNRTNWHVNQNTSAYVGNPHLSNFECYASAQNTMEKFIREGRILDMMNQLIATCASINVVDGPVMRSLITTLKAGHAHNLPIIENIETGELITPKQYKEAYLEAEKAAATVAV